MPREFSRPQRIADQIQRELGETIVREVADPRLEGIVVSGVEVSRDLAHAKVFITVAERADPKATLKVLVKAAGFLRHKLAQRLKIRVLPNLKFVYDETLDRANRIDSLIDEALASDKGSAAGGAPDDPYREDG